MKPTKSYFVNLYTLINNSLQIIMTKIKINPETTNLVREQKLWRNSGASKVAHSCNGEVKTPNSFKLYNSTRSILKMVKNKWRKHINYGKQHKNNKENTLQALREKWSRREDNNENSKEESAKRKMPVGRNKKLYKWRLWLNNHSLYGILRYKWQLPQKL